MAKVNWTFQALEDLSDIGEQLAQNSNSYASHIVKVILEKTELLQSFPELGRIVPESKIKSIRELIIKKYRIIYVLSSDKEVNILAVRHSSKLLGDIPSTT